MSNFAPEKRPEDTRVVVAMSGGVDSSVVAAMLKEQGYDVVGVTLQLYDHGEAVKKKGACCAGQDIDDARQVAEKIDIPHYVLNYEDRFKEAVMDDFVDTYLAGETPIPCVKCNQTVKFRDLLATAKELGAEFMATGHYVQRVEGSQKSELHRGVDTGKDQSYFLFATTQEQLDFLRFPLGGMNKAETRKLAEKYGLPVMDKPDSQDICFVPSGGYAKVIERLHPGALDAGDIVHMDGRVLGQHQGTINHTVGQRKGLNLTDAKNPGVPLYVLKVDAGTNQVIVGPEDALKQQEFIIRDVNWIGDMPLNGQGVSVTVKLRSAHHGVPATAFAGNDNTARIVLDEPQKAISPGQAGVMYDGARLLGGGWIARA